MSKVVGAIILGGAEFWPSWQTVDEGEGISKWKPPNMDWTLGIKQAAVTDAELAEFDRVYDNDLKFCVSLSMSINKPEIADCLLLTYGLSALRLKSAKLIEARQKFAQDSLPSQQCVLLWKAVAAGCSEVRELLAGNQLDLRCSL